MSGPKQTLERRKTSIWELTTLLGPIIVGVALSFAEYYMPKGLCPPNTLFAGPNGFCSYFGPVMVGFGISVLVGASIRQKLGHLPDLPAPKVLILSIGVLVLLSPLLYRDNFLSYFCVSARGISTHSTPSADSVDYAWSDVMQISVGCRTRGGLHFTVTMTDHREVELGRMRAQLEEHYPEIRAALMSKPLDFRDTPLSVDNVRTIVDHLSGRNTTHIYFDDVDLAYCNAYSRKLFWQRST